MPLLTHQLLHQHGTAQTWWTSPLGPLLLARTAQGLAGAWFSEQKDFPASLSAPTHDDDPLLCDSITALQRYFAGQHAAFEHLPLDLLGTPFQHAVWRALLRIGWGQSCSYGDVAQAVGAPRAVRAVGTAIGRNPLSIIVPCHRVLGRDGSLTGYAGGLHRKQALLALESHPAAHFASTQETLI